MTEDALLKEAAESWLSGEGLQTEDGYYRVRTEHVLRGPIAKWNRTVNQKFANAEDFAKWAHQNYCPGCYGCNAGWYKD